MRMFDREFEGRHLHEIMAWQSEKWKSERKKTREAATVNRELCLLKHMFNMAVKWRMLKESPIKDVKRFKGEAKRMRYLVPEEIRKLLSNCDGPLMGYLKPIVTIAVHTGMRKGEIQGLPWPQVDFEQGIITVYDTKHHERRNIPMDETVKDILKGIERKGDLIFPSRRARRIEDAQLHNAFHEALTKSGITDFRFHDLRHTFGSNLAMQEGIELNDIRELLGHKRMDMTLRYAHLSPKHKGKVVNVLDRVLSVSQNPPQDEKVVELRG